MDLDSGLAEDRRRLEAALDAALPPRGAWPQSIHEAVRYSLFAGGKRLRPLLVLAAAEAVGGARADAMPLACAVELIHTYSLIHDDLPAMDDDDLRRGRPTCHRAFGEANAILAGDALLTRAFSVLAEGVATQGEASLRRLQVIALLGEACGTAGLIGGQVEDLEAAGKDIDATMLERIHRAKTGALLRACAEGGGLLAGADTTQTACLRAYGSAIGLAFQIVDDVLDATGDSEQLGKTPGKDARAAKATYVRLHGIEEARKRASDLVGEALAAIEPLRPREARLAALARRVVERSG